MRTRYLVVGMSVLAAGLMLVGGHIRLQQTSALAATASWRSQFPGAISSLPLEYYSISENADGTTRQLPAWLALPAGNGPFPVVILLHGCNGLWGAGGAQFSNGKGAWPQLQVWSQWFASKGYATLIVDSFTPRGYNIICVGTPLNYLQGGQQILQRAVDVYAAAAFLTQLSQIDRRRIVAMGDSNGGGTVLQAVNQNNPYTGNARAALVKAGGRLAAVVALYPSCRHFATPNFSAPVLVLEGTDDTISSPAVCESLTGYPANAGEAVILNQFGAPVTMVLYTGATHVFDVNKPPRRYGGGVIRYDAAATAGSQMQILSFLDRYLHKTGE